jgi:hypothetical protein
MNRTAYLLGIVVAVTGGLVCMAHAFDMLVKTSLRYVPSRKQCKTMAPTIAC